MRTNAELIRLLENNHDVKMTPKEVLALGDAGIETAYCVYCGTASLDLAINDYDVHGNQVCCECMKKEMAAWEVYGECNGKIVNKTVKTAKTMIKYANEGAEITGIPY